jgi:hypothetical protein
MVKLISEMRTDQLEAFLAAQPFMSLQPSAGGIIVLEGDFSFSAVFDGQPQMEDRYALRIVIPQKFPAELPEVSEIGKRIPKLADFHVNADGSLCLGSALSLMVRLQENPTVMGFVSKCVVPYLYAMSLKLDHGIDFVFGELEHGTPGLVDDYRTLFGLQRKEQLFPALNCLLLKKRIANKRPCPCGCGKRLGKCGFNERIRHFRKLFPKAWLRKHLQGK